MQDSTKFNTGKAGEVIALGLALQDALSDLVQVHGIGYLDIFLERRLRRTVQALRQSGHSLPEAQELAQAIGDEAEAALRREIEAVRRDPSPVR